MVERVRVAGVCGKCGVRIQQVVDDMYHETEGVSEPYDTLVMRAWCSPGCDGARDED